MNLKLNIYAIYGFDESKVIHEHGQDTAFTNQEVCAVESAGRIFNRHAGDAARALLGLRQFISHYGLLAIEVVQVFAQYRALSGIKLFHMNLSGVPVRFTFADALNLRDWRIYHALPMRPLLQKYATFLPKNRQA